MTQFKNFNQVQTANDFAQEFCQETYTATLAATTDTTLVVPGTANMGNFPAYENNKFIAVIRVEVGENVWIALNETAASPAGATFAASTSELISGAQTIAKYVELGDTLHFYTTGTDVPVSVAFYPLSGY